MVSGELGGVDDVCFFVLETVFVGVEAKLCGPGVVVLGF